ncbi:LysR family transcriptional regulator [Thaumasiovibrio sp. DFM-14]|uniref:LysR family transcriptional regulator n=1 Tax=Thaumasiovibrio sp. DFM-14 TaxID=3384792 RepID=UPI00399EF5DF
MHTLEQLNSYIAVYETGSYSAAAKRLGKSRATVREQVVSYEDSLGYSLFNIEGRQAKPTPRADALYYRANLVIRQSEALQQYSKAFFDSELISITVCHDVNMPLQMMLYLDEVMRQKFPQINIHWLHRNRQEAFSALIKQEAQIAFLTPINSVLPEQELIFIPLGNLPTSVYVGSQSPLLKQPEMDLREIQFHTQYVTENSVASGSPYARLSANTRVVSNLDVLCHLVSRHGWALLPDEHAVPYVRSGLLAKLEVEAIVNVTPTGTTLFYRYGAELNSPIKYLIDSCRDYAREHFV